MNEYAINKVMAAGVVGAGGAGFPTHVKLNAKVDKVLANGASCEPLLMSDPYLLEHETDQVLRGLAAVVDCTEAQNGVVCLKGKHAGAMAEVRKKVSGMSDSRFSVFELRDFYPAGDEHVLVYEVMGKTVPEAGLPLQVGAVVSNIESLRNIADALDGLPVTDRYLTIAGEVAQPMVVKAPVGMRISDLIRLAGGPLTGDYRVVDGGPMMGRVINDVSDPITKTTSGILVLPADHNVVAGKVRDPETIKRIAKLACCQCTLCTELCPRYLLGHNLHPHKLMRSLELPPAQSQDIRKEALLCSECGICEKFACPMMISPREVNVQIKRELMSQGIRWENGSSDLECGVFRDVRYVPTKRLMERLNVSKYDGHPGFYNGPVEPSEVRLLLKQHIGAPSTPVVKEGDKVSKGDLVADIPEKALGASIHASIDGIVASVDQDAVVIKKR